MKFSKSLKYLNLASILVFSSSCAVINFFADQYVTRYTFTFDRLRNGFVAKLSFTDNERSETVTVYHGGDFLGFNGMNIKRMDDGSVKTVYLSLQNKLEAANYKDQNFDNLYYNAFSKIDFKVDNNSTYELNDSELSYELIETLVCAPHGTFNSDDASIENCCLINKNGNSEINIKYYEHFSDKHYSINATIIGVDARPYLVETLQGYSEQDEIEGMLDLLKNKNFEFSGFGMSGYVNEDKMLIIFDNHDYISNDFDAYFYVIRSENSAVRYEIKNYEVIDTRYLHDYNFSKYLFPSFNISERIFYKDNNKYKIKQNVYAHDVNITSLLLPYLEKEIYLNLSNADYSVTDEFKIDFYNGTSLEYKNINNASFPSIYLNLI